MDFDEKHVVWSTMKEPQSQRSASAVRRVPQEPDQKIERK
jgi:hypothetical protein